MDPPIPENAEKVSEPSGSTTRPDSVLSDVSEIPDTELRQTLKERHVNMIGFSTVLGVGLFLSAGKAIFMAGPGATVLAYIIMGTVMWSVMACLGEMTALFPIKGPIFEFPRRFVDQSIGFAIGWISWFSWTVIAAVEILAITEIFRFRFDPKYLQSVGYPEDRVEWKAGLDTNPAIWVGIFLIIILLINLLPVRQYGRVEYVFGCIKIIFLVGVIMFNMILNARQKFHDTRFWTYETPWGFSRANFTVKAYRDGSPKITYTGSLGGLTSFWTTMTTTLFSLMGWEIILYTAAENRDLRKAETIKLATRKISLRVILLYALAAFTVGLNVPYTDDHLRDLTLLGVPGGQNSVFVIAAIREHVKGIPHLINGFFIFSACSTGVNCLYAASRTLHALASIRDAWPSWTIFESIRSRLERTRLGVPMNAVFVSWLVGFVAFLSTNSVQMETLGRMSTITVVANLIIYAVNCVAYLNFYREVNSAARGDLDEDLNLSPEMRAHYKRSARQYPYRSHLQWIRAAYAFVGCVLMIIFQGWRTFIPPMSKKDFVAAYIAVVLFIAISLAYFVKDRGFSPRNWRVLALKLSGLESVGPIVVVSDSVLKPCDFCGARHRRGHLHFPDKILFSKNNARALVEWIWTWLK
ncbi:uncharacterized protein BDR25DRAFT_272286 [Lindgomyces ingoldianus]|uniref:Uncharacterized protein n=1 Tax=Lindgomyces ingoldianus TaxID=673940 RepID=A0ACB6QAR0_9PLEO|nr:uncharacterized protein BDR25DRAFT_272286 [Lindgomyces ingoldianus]KAF2463996.1 hypothetical protein BDR25DRAFT_272286 [Lindgomyces ingoldianus]